MGRKCLPKVMINIDRYLYCQRDNSYGMAKRRMVGSDMSGFKWKSQILLSSRDSTFGASIRLVTCLITHIMIRIHA